MDTKLLGSYGEQRAAAFLRDKGYKLVGMNYHTRLGEIDLIVSDRKYIVFVEVKLRRSASFAAAREYVTVTKRRHIIAAAQSWLQKNPSELQPRFDVIEVYAPEGMKESSLKIEHIENAFTLDY